MTGFDVEGFLDDYQPRTVEAHICGKPDLLVEHERLEAELTGARSAAGDVMFSKEVADLARQVRDLEDKIAAAERVFVFGALSRKAWQDLIRAHPPNKDDRAEGLDHHPDTFIPAAISACARAPELTVEQVARLDETLPFTEFEKLWQATLTVNLGSSSPPKSVLAAAIERLTQNGGSSTTAAPAGSPDGSS